MRVFSATTSGHRTFEILQLGFDGATARFTIRLAMIGALVASLAKEP